MSTWSSFLLSRVSKFKRSNWVARIILVFWNVGVALVTLSRVCRSAQAQAVSLHDLLLQGKKESIVRSRLCSLNFSNCSVLPSSWVSVNRRFSTILLLPSSSNLVPYRLVVITVYNWSSLRPVPLPRAKRPPLLALVVVPLVTADESRKLLRLLPFSLLLLSRFTLKSWLVLR